MKLVLVYLLSFFLQGETIATGTWTKSNYSIDGGWRIEKIGDKLNVILDNDFATKKAPDLKIFFSKEPLDGLTSKNAVLVTELTSNKGSQSYVIDKDIDITTYQTILIHCEKYSVLWGGAPLNL